jgi:hypothetical protein
MEAYIAAAQRRQALETALPWPIAVHHYIDRAQIWRSRPLSKKQTRDVEGDCAPDLRRRRPQDYKWQEPFSGLHVLNHSVSFGGRHYCQRNQVCRPGKIALSTIDDERGVHLNRLELALDLIFPDKVALVRAFHFLRDHLVKPWHNSQRVFHYTGTNGITLYWGSPHVPCNIVIYADLPCRITGEPYCLHVEYRIQASAAILRAGLSLAALDPFHAHSFWHKIFRLAFVDGHLLDHALAKAGLPPFRYKTDCAQFVVDQLYGTGIRTSEYLQPLGAKFLLPPLRNRPLSLAHTRACARGRVHGRV